MSARLHCYSFHSVKGGVGKSTLSTFLACGLAREMPTTLIDMDLTGTSLGDVLPLRAPRWSEGMDLTKPPDNGFYTRAETRDLIAARNAATRASELVEPPFLNDFLLYPTPTSSLDEDVHDMHPTALGWHMDGAPERLRVMPSSALPRDLERILPVIFDEEHAAFLEGRLELLLDQILQHWHPEAPERAVVFDTPPTIPGLSRSVLSLALRMGRAGQQKQPLADDGYIPPALKAADIRWTIFLVVTMDMQDLRAADRWLELVNSPDEESLFRVAINRVSPQLEPDQIESKLRSKLMGPDPLSAPSAAVGSENEPGAGGELLALWDFPYIPITDQPGMQFFGDEQVPPDIAELLARLRG